MAGKSCFWERRAVDGFPLILDEQRGALIINVDERALSWSFWIRAPRARLGFHAEARWHVIHAASVCAVVYTSLPPGLYTVREPLWAAGAYFRVSAGSVTYGEIRTVPTHPAPLTGGR